MQLFPFLHYDNLACTIRHTFKSRNEIKERRMMNQSNSLHCWENFWEINSLTLWFTTKVGRCTTNNCTTRNKREMSSNENSNYCTVGVHIRILSPTYVIHCILQHCQSSSGCCQQCLSRFVPTSKKTQITWMGGLKVLVPRTSDVPLVGQDEGREVVWAHP